MQSQDDHKIIGKLLTNNALLSISLLDFGNLSPFGMNCVSRILSSYQGCQ